MAINTHRQMLKLSPLALVLAAGLTACGTKTARTTYTTTPTNLSGSAELASMDLEEGLTEGIFTKQDYMTHGEQQAIPTKWVSEAREGTAKNESVRAAAQASELRAYSNYSESMASARADLQDGFVQRDTGYADAERTRGVYDARLYQMSEQIESRQVAAMTKHSKQEAFLSASVQEWQAEIERMRTSAERDWYTSLAEHDRMLASAEAVRERGLAEIGGMVKSAEMTEQRATEKAAALRSDSRTVASQSNSEVGKLNKLIETTTRQTNAQVSELTQRARSLDKELSSEIATLDARAQEFQSSDAEENYKLEVEAATVQYESSLAAAEDLRLQADERAKRDQAEADRRTADANARMSAAQTTFDEAQKWIDSEHTKSMADVELLEAQAVRAEELARSAFVRAETDAQVSAMLEKAQHDRALAESERERIEAEAYAEAESLEAKFAKEFAQKLSKGEVTLDESKEQREPGVSAGDALPELAKAGDKAANVEVDRIAAFKSGLAKAAELRQKAKAAQLEADAQRDGELAKFTDWFNEKQSDFDTSVAMIRAFERKSDADVSSMLTRSESMIAGAETEKTRSLVEAESGKTEVLASIETLRGNALSLDKKRAAQVKQLQAQAKAAQRIGDSKVASLTVQRDATQRRGQAKSAQLLAEANSHEQSQRALVAQMYEEIDAARHILDSELDRLDQAAASFLAVAEANYNEEIAMADAFERIALANTAELTARHIASREQSEADLTFMRHVANAGELRRDAAVARAYAEADEKLGMARSQNIAARGQVEADRQIAAASAMRDFAVADARDQGVKMRFDHRVAMTQADRDRTYADMYEQAHDHLARTEIAAAQAKTYEELSQVALERLHTTSRAFQLTAQRNWDQRLTMPASFGSTDAPKLPEASSIDPAIANVPTDFE